MAAETAAGRGCQAADACSAACALGCKPSRKSAARCACEAAVKIARFFALQRFEPGADIGGMVDANLGGDFEVGGKESGAKLHKLLHGIADRANGRPLATTRLRSRVSHAQLAAFWITRVA